MRVKRGCGVVVYRVGFAAVWLAYAVTTGAAQTPGLPSPWSSQDIGSPSQPGTATADASGQSFTITATGRDIWSDNDQFHFVFQPVSGDGEIVARVDDLAPTNAWAKAGVMIRGSLAANAAHASAFVTPSSGVAFQSRAATGEITSHTAGPDAPAPYWVRLGRQGSHVTAYSSPDGTAWQAMGTVSIALSDTAYVGLAVASHDAAASTTAALSGVTVKATALPPPQTALPPPQKDADIGSPAVAGSATYQSGAYTLTAGGTDIYGTADQFHYVYQPVTGNADVAIRVASLSGPNRWSKAGVMFRETLAADSAHAFALLS